MRTPRTLFGLPGNGNCNGSNAKTQSRKGRREQQNSCRSARVATVRAGTTIEFDWNSKGKPLFPKTGAMHVTDRRTTRLNARALSCGCSVLRYCSSGVAGTISPARGRRVRR
jgi:hypothetical protein